MARLFHNLLLLTVRLTLKIKVLGYWSLIYGYCALCTAVALLKLWWSILIRPSTTFQWALRETPPACLNDTSLGTHCYVRIKVRFALHHESIWRRSVRIWIESFEPVVGYSVKLRSGVLEANANEQRRALAWNEIVRYLLTNSLFNICFQHGLLFFRCSVSRCIVVAAQMFSRGAEDSSVRSWASVSASVIDHQWQLDCKQSHNSCRRVVICSELSCSFITEEKHRLLQSFSKKDCWLTCLIRWHNVLDSSYTVLFFFSHNCYA